MSVQIIIIIAEKAYVETEIITWSGRRVSYKEADVLEAGVSHPYQCLSARDKLNVVHIKGSSTPNAVTNTTSKPTRPQSLEPGPNLLLLLRQAPKRKTTSNALFRRLHVRKSPIF